MKTTEFHSFAHAKNTWTYDTPYDLAMLDEIIASNTDGKNNQRLCDIENYIDYINNDMPESYRVALQIYRPLTHYGVTRIVQEQSKSIWLYERSCDNEFVELKYVNGLRHFVGDKIFVENNKAYLADTTRNLAVQSMGAYDLKMINIDDESDNANRSIFTNFEYKIDKILANRALWSVSSKT